MVALFAVLRQDDPGFDWMIEAIRVKRVVCPHSPKRKGVCVINSLNVSSPGRQQHPAVPNEDRSARVSGLPRQTPTHPRPSSS